MRMVQSREPVLKQATSSIHSRGTAAGEVANVEQLSFVPELGAFGVMNAFAVTTAARLFSGSSGHVEVPTRGQAW